MAFTLKLAREVFPDARVERGAEPEFCIAKGLAWAGRIDRKAKAFREEINHILAVEVPRLVEAKMPDLIAVLASVTARKLTEDFILAAFIRWREGLIRTLADIEPEVQKAVRNWLDSAAANEYFGEAIAEWLKSLTSDLQHVTDPICERHAIPRAALRLETLVPEGGKLPDGFINSTELMGLDDLAVIVTLVLSCVGGAIAGGAGTALLFHGPIGWIIGAVAAFLLLAVGTEKALEEVKKRDIPVLMRKVVTVKRIGTKLGEQQKDFEQKVLASFQASADLQHGISERLVSSIREELQKSAESAELLIK